MDQEARYYQYLELLTREMASPGQISVEAVYEDLRELCRMLRVCKGVTSLDGVTDETSWANAYGESLAATLQENGETVTSAELGSVVIGDGKNATIYQIVSEANGATLYRSVIFMLDEDGDGLRVQFLATSQEMLQTLLDSIGSVSE